MKADIEWAEKLNSGIKRKVRVTFLGHGSIKWQFKCSDEPSWDYDSAPAAADWDTLLQKLEGLYNRRRIPFKHLELVRALRTKAEKE